MMKVGGLSLPFNEGGFKIVKVAGGGCSVRRQMWDLISHMLNVTGGDKSDPKRGRANQTLNLGGFKILKVAGRRGAMSDVKYGWRLSHI